MTDYRTHDGKPLVDLSAVANEPSGPAEQFFGCIIERPSGIVWTNTTRGIACAGPRAEGIFVPLPSLWLCDDLPDFNAWGDVDYTTEVVAPWLRSNEYRDAVGGSRSLADLFAPRSDFDGSWGEAWMPVLVGTSEKNLEEAAPQLLPFMGCAAVLTWGNSD